MSGTKRHQGNCRWYCTPTHSPAPLSRHLWSLFFISLLLHLHTSPLSSSHTQGPRALPKPRGGTQDYKSCLLPGQWLPRGLRICKFPFESPCHPASNPSQVHKSRGEEGRKKKGTPSYFRLLSLSKIKIPSGYNRNSHYYYLLIEILHPILLTEWILGEKSQVLIKATVKLRKDVKQNFLHVNLFTAAKLVRMKLI